MKPNLELRIRQLHHALSNMRSDAPPALQPEIGIEDGYFYTRVDFTTEASDAELANILSLCIANMACLKDHLKLWCSRTGHLFDCEAFVSSTRDVAIIHDLWNRDKHCEFNRPTRSGVRPELLQIRRVMSLTTRDQVGSFVGYQFDPASGQFTQIGDGSVELLVTADVVDEQGVVLGDLIEIAERAVLEWETVMMTAGVTVPRRR